MAICSQTALNGYSIMWLYVMFDLPVETKRQRKVAARFRKDLLKDGFGMHQFSVYSKLLLNPTASQAMLKRLKSNNPKKGLHLEMLRPISHHISLPNPVVSQYVSNNPHIRESNERIMMLCFFIKGKTIVCVNEYTAIKKKCQKFNLLADQLV